MARDGSTVSVVALLAALAVVCACAVSAPSETRQGVPTQAAIAAQGQSMGEGAVYDLFRTRESAGGRQADSSRALSLRPDRKLTADEEAKRDLLIRLVVDPDGDDVPFPSRYYPREHQRIAMLRYRRRAAASLLGIHVAHDSMVAPLAAYLASSRPVLAEEISDVRVRDQEHATALALLSSERLTRDAVLGALAQSGSGEAMSVIIQMGVDPQLGREARRYLSRLVVPHVPASLLPPYSQDVSDAEKQAAVDRLVEWWEWKRGDVEAPRHFSSD